MRRLFERGAHAALGLWIGAVACVAFVVAPTVFRTLDDDALAGKVMAPIFQAVDVFGVAAAALFAVAARGRKWRALGAAALGAAALVNVVIVAPKVTARENLELYHKVAEVLWGVVLFGGLWLLLLGPRPRERR